MRSKKSYGMIAAAGMLAVVNAASAATLTYDTTTGTPYLWSTTDARWRDASNNLTAWTQGSDAAGALGNGTFNIKGTIQVGQTLFTAGNYQHTKWTGFDGNAKVELSGDIVISGSVNGSVQYNLPIKLMNNVTVSSSSTGSFGLELNNSAVVGLDLNGYKMKLYKTGSILHRVDNGTLELTNGGTAFGFQTFDNLDANANLIFSGTSFWNNAAKTYSFNELSVTSTGDATKKVTNTNVLTVNNLVVGGVTKAYGVYYATDLPSVIATGGSITVNQNFKLGVKGNDQTILSGDSSPSAADYTDFGTTETFVDRLFTVTNTGNTDLNIAGVTLPTGFSLIEGLSNSLAMGASDTFTVRFSSLTAGTFGGNILIDSNAADFTYAVTGTMIIPEPASLSLLGLSGLALLRRRKA